MLKKDTEITSQFFERNSSLELEGLFFFLFFIEGFFGEGNFVKEGPHHIMKSSPLLGQAPQYVTPFINLLRSILQEFRFFAPSTLI